MLPIPNFLANSSLELSVLSWTGDSNKLDGLKISKIAVNGILGKTFLGGLFQKTNKRWGHLLWTQKIIVLLKLNAP